MAPVTGVGLTVTSHNTILPVHPLASVSITSTA
jgi:hypothetical protein